MFEDRVKYSLWALAYVSLVVGQIVSLLGCVGCVIGAGFWAEWMEERTPDIPQFIGFFALIFFSSIVAISTARLPAK